jgi:hypothetical protein
MRFGRIRTDSLWTLRVQPGLGLACWRFACGRVACSSRPFYFEPQDAQFAEQARAFVLSIQPGDSTTEVLASWDIGEHTRSRALLFPL